MKRFWIFLLSLVVSVSASAQYANVHLSGRTVVGSLPNIKVDSAPSGIVVVTIKVDQYGNVTEAIPGAEGTTVTDKALWTASRNAAMKAHFNQKANAPAVQEGIISYVFEEGTTPKTSSKDVLRFMGIPVDGTEYQVRMSLIRKGFSYNPTTKWFSGQFNGKDVRLSIHTNHRVVDRIYVRFPSVDKFSIKNEYNILLRQLSNTGKYLSSIINSTISEEENAADSISFGGKSYEACFYYLNTERDPDIYSETISLHRELLDIKDSEELEMVNTLSAQLDTLSDEDYEKHPDSKYIDGFIEKTAEKAALLSVYVDYLTDGQVWFTIHKDGSQYFISLYYDNLHNRPHGEDL